MIDRDVIEGVMDDLDVVMASLFSARHRVYRAMSGEKCEKKRKELDNLYNDVNKILKTRDKFHNRLFEYLRKLDDC